MNECCLYELYEHHKKNLEKNSILFQAPQCCDKAQKVKEDRAKSAKEEWQKQKRLVGILSGLMKSYPLMKQWWKEITHTPIEQTEEEMVVYSTENWHVPWNIADGRLLSFWNGPFLGYIVFFFVV